jgi:hypothetical protein
MYINVHTYMHLHLMPLHRLCSWFGCGPGQACAYTYALLCVQHISGNNCYETNLNLLLMAVYFYFVISFYVL